VDPIVIADGALGYLLIVALIGVFARFPSAGLGILCLAKYCPMIRFGPLGLHHVLIVGISLGALVTIARSRGQPMGRRLALPILLPLAASSLWFVLNMWLPSYPDPVLGYNFLVRFAFTCLIPTILLALVLVDATSFRQFAWSGVIASTVTMILLWSTTQNSIWFLLTDVASRPTVLNLDPINLANDLAIAGVLALPLMDHRFGRTVVPIYLLAVVPAILISKTRQAVGGLVGGLLAYVAYGRQRWALLGPMVIVMAVIAVAAVLQFSDTALIQRYVNSEQGDVGGRLESWQRAVEFFVESPLTGTGTGTFGAITGRPYLTVTGEVVEEREHPHNLVLSLLAEQGLVGFCLVALYFGTVLRSISGAWRSGGSHPVWLMAGWSGMVQLIPALLLSGAWWGSGNFYWLLAFLWRAGQLTAPATSTIEITESAADLQPAFQI
jgi:O-antigen ligase